MHLKSRLFNSQKVKKKKKKKGAAKRRDFVQFLLLEEL